MYYSASGNGSGDVTSAFNQWNQLSGTTNVNFVQGNNPATGNPDVYAVPATAANVCANATAGNGRIVYGPALSPAISNNPTLATLTFAHEIGHLLGLADNSSLNNHDIMDQSVGCPGSAGYSWDVDPNAATGQGAQSTFPPSMTDAKQLAKCQNKFSKCNAKK